MTNQPHSLTSVGIDIGTTSCHLVFSRLSLVNEASTTQIPRLAIGERTVLYESPIFITPLNLDDSINGASVAQIMRDQYSQAGFKPDDIDCGAVIITGETARLRNAAQVLQEISSLAGDFVAASAGPELESVLAGRGSGALQYSRDNGKTICNIDIGGGTTNIAVFKNGALIETACLRIGGRWFQFTKQGVLTKISIPAGQLIRDFENGEGTLEGVKVGSTVPDETLVRIAQHLANSLLNFVCTPNQNSGLEGLLLSKPLAKPYDIDEFWFSGGVAELMAAICSTSNCSGTEQSDSNISTSTAGIKRQNSFAYEDFGWFLANGISKALAELQVPNRIAKNPIRATVLGAGSYTVQLSGNTVSTSTVKLPIKGIPLLRPFQDLTLEPTPPCPEEILHRLKKAIVVHDHGISDKSVAIILNFEVAPNFSDLRAWAKALAMACKTNNLQLPYIVIVNTDSAMALGQLMRGELKHNDVVVLDGIDLTTGDYIDIGKPIGSGSTIPVTVKTLVFANN